MKHFISVILTILDRNERVRMCIHAILDVVIGMLDIVFLGFLLLIVNYYTSGGTPGSYVFLRSVTNKSPLLLIGVFFLLFTLKNWLGYRISGAQYLFFYSVASRLSRRNIYQYLRGGYMPFVNTDSSEYFRKISQQPIEFSNYILTNVQLIISQGILIFFTVTGILFYHPALFLSLFMLLLPPVILVAMFIKRKLKRVRAEIKINSQLTIQHLQESLSGYVESNIYDKNDFFANRFYRSQALMNEHIATQQTLQALPGRLIEIFAVLGFFILIAVNKLSANAPAIDMLTIGVFMAAAYKIIPGIIKILNSAGQIKTYQFTLDDLAATAGQTPAADDCRTACPVTSFRFENVHFKYHRQTILQDTSFEINRGDFAGMSAESGKGKTTIINLLLGFLEPGCGAIYVNNKKTNGLERQHSQNRISYVKQQPFFIHESILKNVTLSDEEYSHAKLAEVISFCGIDQMLENYPDDLQKVIRENGKNISGGQRQRIMLARALYHDFDLLILDEPFSEMDNCSERAILAQLQQIVRNGKMILFITHNKASLSFCNKIISLDGE